MMQVPALVAHGDEMFTVECEWTAPYLYTSLPSQKYTTHRSRPPSTFCVSCPSEANVVSYPDWRELQAYFDHVDKVLNLSKNCAFQTVVTSSEFDESTGKWTVKTSDGRTAKARFLIVAARFAAKRYIPGFPSMDKFRGIMCHSSFWPNEGIDYENKRVAVIGTGASGVQMIQEMGPVATQLDVYQRTPNLALPTGRRDLSKEEQDKLKPYYPQILAYREKCFAGFNYDRCERDTFHDTPEEREAFFDEVWAREGFALWLGGYKDYLFDDKANDEAYQCWRKRQSERVKNPEKNRILFPEKKPHPFGVKRPCLEQNYYEVFDRDNVGLIDINDQSGTPIVEFTEKGIKTSDGKEREYDIIALATGFDVVTGGMTSMGLKSHQRNLPSRRVERRRTHLSRHHHLRLSQHVPPVRASWTYAPLQSSVQRRGPGPLDP